MKAPPHRAWTVLVGLQALCISACSACSPPLCSNGTAQGNVRIDDGVVRLVGGSLPYGDVEDDRNPLEGCETIEGTLTVAGNLKRVSVLNGIQSVRGGVFLFNVINDSGEMFFPALRETPSVTVNGRLGVGDRPGRIPEFRAFPALTELGVLDLPRAERNPRA